MPAIALTGGSSSGSAASVAAGIVPAAFGGDTVGSIRVPASLCGVVGFKPTTGRWPRAGVAPISHILDTTGVFARSVEDCELIDQVVTKAPASTLSDKTGLKESSSHMHRGNILIWWSLRLKHASKRRFDNCATPGRRSWKSISETISPALAEKDNMEHLLP